MVALKKLKSLATDKNKQQQPLQLLQKDFRNVECSNNNNIEYNGITKLKRKIETTLLQMLFKIYYFYIPSVIKKSKK